MLFKQQKFLNNERVVIHSIGREVEFHGSIVGKAVIEPGMAFPEHYIVKIDEGAARMRGNYDYDCICITEACLRRE